MARWGGIAPLVSRYAQHSRCNTSSTCRVFLIHLSIPCCIYLIYTTPVATTVARSADESLKPGFGYWLLNKLFKRTFIWRKKYFFLEFYNIFHLKSFIKSLIFNENFSGWFALCLLFPCRYDIESPHLS